MTLRNWTKNNTPARKAALVAAVRDGNAITKAQALTMTPTATLSYWRKTDAAFSAELASALAMVKTAPRPIETVAPEIVQRLVQGQSLQQIADGMGVCVGTAGWRVYRMKQRYGVSTRAQLVEVSP